MSPAHLGALSPLLWRRIRKHKSRKVTGRKKARKGKRKERKKEREEGKRERKKRREGRKEKKEREKAKEPLRVSGRTAPLGSLARCESIRVFAGREDSRWTPG